MTPFITANANIIANYTQQPFPLRLQKQNGEYRNSIQQSLHNPDFENALRIIPDPISRQGVLDCYKVGLYEGFVATLLWGGKQNDRFGGLQKIINNNSKADIVKRLTSLKVLLEENKIEDAYNSMLHGNNIQYVNESFFTKIMFFISKNMNVVPQPLILDSVMHWVCCAFMIEGGEDYHNHYNLVNNTLQTNQNNYNGTTYVDYLNKMNNKATIIGVSPDKLEAFLFSECPIAIGVVPRQYVYSYVITNF